MTIASDQIERRQLLAESTHHPNTLELADIAFREPDEPIEPNTNAINDGRRSFLRTAAGGLAAVGLGGTAFTQPAEAACGGVLVCHFAGESSNRRVTLCVSGEGRSWHLRHHDADHGGSC